MGQEVSVTTLTTAADLLGIHEEEKNAKLSWHQWESCDLFFFSFFQWNQALITNFKKLSVKECILLM